MPRRLLAFAIAFVIIGGPLAGDMCEVLCAEHAGHSIDSAVPASHHHHSTEAVGQPSPHHHSDAAPVLPTRSVGLIPPPHGCDHLEAVISESRELTRPIVQAVAMMPRIILLRVHVLPVSEPDCRHGPPTSIRSTSPLRI